MKGFSSNGRLEKLERELKSGQSGIRVATVEDCFYTVWGSPNPDMFENAMNDVFETPAAPVFREILEKNCLPDPNTFDDLILSNFITLQFLRSPIKRTIDVSFMRKKAQNDPNFIARTKKMSEDMILKELALSHMDHWWHIEMPKLLLPVHRMQKILVIFDEDFLATSNSPVSLIFKNNGQAPVDRKISNKDIVVMPAGNIEDSLAVFYPFSRKMGVILLPANCNSNSIALKGTAKIACIFNWLLGQASNVLFYHPEDSAYFKDFYGNLNAKSSLFQVKRFVDSLNSDNRHLMFRNS